VIVVDASAAVAGLLHDGPARAFLGDGQVHVPHLVDVEVTNALRRLVSVRALPARSAGRVLDVWARLGMTRYPTVGLLERIWQLRDNLSAYDASYVAIAESLGCMLVTADARLSAAPGLRCAVTWVPR
jgi:predicted nucleic acid-binding protein